MAGKDYYHSLGVAENASAEEIKKAYRRLAKQFHPDANQGSKQAEARFKEISEAYNVLSDPKKRAQYDQMKRFGASGYGPQGFPGGYDGFDFRRGDSGGFNFEEFGFGSFGDILSSLFGDVGMRTHRRRRGFPNGAPNRGADLALTLELSFAEAVLGVRKTIRLRRDETCSRCNGKGSEPGAESTICPECKGSGMVTFSQGAFAVSRPCPRCLGTGEIRGRACTNCNGRGSVRGEKTLAVKIPAGIESGGRVRLKGMGQVGEAGGQYGDLIVTVRVNPDSFLRRKDKDIFCSVPLSLKQAMEGSRIKVRTVSGQAIVKIPALTKSGAVFKLKGQGIRVGETSGDQFVEVQVKLPENPTPEEQEMIQKLQGEAVRSK